MTEIDEMREAVDIAFDAKKRTPWNVLWNHEIRVNDEI